MSGPDSSADELPHYLSARRIAALKENESRHQFNDQAVRHSRSIADELGLQRIGLHLVRLTQGCYSTEFHYHEHDEEFLYVVSGRGEARIGDRRVDVGPGDFMAFPENSAAHALFNPHEEDLVYLMGGERNANDVVQYPDIQKTMIKSGQRRFSAGWAAFEDQPPKKG